MQRVLDISFARRGWFAVLVCTLLVTPFFFVTIPPLTDVPGHMGGSAAAVYAASDPTFARLMGFHWHLVPNLGADLIVSMLRRVVGITGAYWLVAALIPPLLAAGILMISRILNPHGAAAICWALLFIYCFPFNYGFLNYMLGVALSLIGFAVWMLLDDRPVSREAATWIAVPLLFLFHVVAGCLFVLFIGSREFESLRRQGRLRALPRRIRPLLSSVMIILLWRLSTQSFAGKNAINFKGKLNALVMLLRDQNFLLDVGSLIAALAVFVIGWRSGARPHRAVAPAVLLLILLFVTIPNSLSSSEYADERLLPLIPMLAFATQDWSRVDIRLARLVAISGMALLVVRLGFTLAGFIAYDARFSSEMAALDDIPDHSRVLILNAQDCDARLNWRSDRLGHLGDLAIVYRHSWTNSEWDIDGIHLLQVLYRPSKIFYHDPSQYVWPSSCGNVLKHRPTMDDALATIPFGGIDYLWLLNASLPAGYSNSRLSIRWRHGSSTLYAVRQGKAQSSVHRHAAGPDGWG